MRILKTILYKFHELKEKAQAAALQNMYNINIDYEWWEFTYQDAASAELKISAFDLDRGDYCSLEYIDGPGETADSILAAHGESCATWKAAKRYQQGQTTAAELLQELAAAYLQSLKNEYEFLISDNAIKDTIIANDYEFTRDGVHV